MHWLRTPVVITVVISVAYLVSGCTTHYFAALSSGALQDLRLASHYHVSRSAPWVVAQQTPIYLAQVADASAEARPRATFNLHEVLSATLKQRYPFVEVGLAPMPLNQALIKAAQSNKQLLFWPQLVSIEDRLNTRQELGEGKELHPEIQSGPDRVLFTVHIYDVGSGALLDVSTVSGRGRMFADAAAVPADLFYGASTAFANTLSGKPRS